MSISVILSLPLCYNESVFLHRLSPFLLTIASRPAHLVPCPFQNVPPLAVHVLDAYGPQRVMWGSDWPPVSSREGYDSSLCFPLDYFAGLSENERAWIFGKTAQRVWGLEIGRLGD